jgi:hypothetical protein
MGSGGTAPPFLISSLDEWPASRPSPRGRNLRNPLVRRLGEPQVGLDHLDAVQ